ncbi:MAG TPA: glycerophosphodiester phosphodiesterase family protein, partial [Allosphingosinicella sp.]|nr:glycerophosphodiester phosphodiesterase family protein [Allosphingosinicella sp.]
AAFAAATDGGFGIELDVQLSGDGVAMVFHDYQLERLTEAAGNVAVRSAAELAGIRLRGADEAVPTLAEILALIAGRAPLLIEVKSPDRHVRALCGAVDAALASYLGAVGVMSFNPEVGRWFARHRPERLRGLVVSENGKHGRLGRIKRNLSLWRARPDFLAYDIRDLPSDVAAFARFGGTPVYTWTVRTDEDRARAAAHADQIIFEQPAA